MIKRMTMMILAVVLIVGGMVGFKFMMAAGTKQYLATKGMTPESVSTTKAAVEEWQQTLDAVGSLRALNGVDLSSEASGIVVSLSFDSGADVEEGAELVRLRDDDDAARLRALEAAANLAQITLDRDMKQIKANAISQATVDADTAALNNAKAQVAAQKAAVEKKTVKAPFKGTIGIRKIDVGQFLVAGTPIATLQQLDSVYADFNLPERNLPQIAVGQKVSVAVDAVPNRSFEGEIAAINAKIDEATRNVQVRALLKNPERKLLPGMFAHVSITTGEPQKFVTLPQTSITYNPYGNTVYVVGKDDKGSPIAKQTFVTLGASRGDQVAIVSGLKEGDEVVTAGQLKLRNGTPLIVNNEIQPKNDPAPTPIDR